MANRGIAPADLSTDVGKFRQKSNDLIYGPLNPVEPGYGDYTYNSDEEIKAWIESGEGSLFMGLGFFYLSLASDAAIKSNDIKDHDLAVKTYERAVQLRETAQMWFDLANDADVVDGGQDIFEVFPTGPTTGYRSPELAYGLHVL